MKPIHWKDIDETHGVIHRIDLLLIQGGRRVLAGRDRGKDACEFFKLLDIPVEDKVEVHVPENMTSVNVSFFIGMFKQIIYKLGDRGFREKYTFTGFDIKRTIAAGIAEARPPGGWRPTLAHKKQKFELGQLVLTVQPEKEPTDWNKSAMQNRQWNVLGIIIGYHSSHGVFYDVRHQDNSTGCYEPRELMKPST